MGKAMLKQLAIIVVVMIVVAQLGKRFAIVRTAVPFQPTA